MSFFTTFVLRESPIHYLEERPYMSSNKDFRKIYEESEKQFLENATPVENGSQTGSSIKSLLGFVLGFIAFVLIALLFIYLGTLISAQ